MQVALLDPIKLIPKYYDRKATIITIYPSKNITPWAHNKDDEVSLPERVTIVDASAALVRLPIATILLLSFLDSLFHSNSIHRNSWLQSAS